MLAPLHAYYMILQAFTVDFMQLHSLHANPVIPWDFKIPGSYELGRVNSGSWFEAAQYRANQLAAATGGRGTKCHYMLVP